MNKLKSNKLSFMETTFKLLYLIFSFMTFCNFANNKPTIAYVIIAVAALAAAFYRLMHFKGYLKTPGLIFAVLFIVSYAVSAILNYKYGIVDNAKYFIWLGMHFALFYATDAERSAREYKKEFTLIARAFIVVSALLVLISLIQFYSKYSLNLYTEDEERILAGFVWGRLWGAFTDPNYASTFSVISALLSVHLFRNTAKKLFKGLYIANFVIQFMYISFSDSRTGLVALFGCAFVYSYFMLIKKHNFTKVSRQIKCIALAFVIAIGCASVPTIIKQVNNVTQNVIQSIFPETPGEEDPDDPDLTVGREGDLENDISNRRFDLWKSGIEIFEKRPVFGASYFNLINFAKENTPETYLINNDRGEFNNMHSILFNILASQGAVGIIIFLSFAGYVIVFVFRRINKVPKEDYEYIVVLVSAMVAGFVASLFVSDIIYSNSPNAFMFWLCAGYLMHYLSKIDVPKLKDKSK